jgi:cobalt-zinc-cadmium efflux system membrane fusion protein
MPLSDHQMTRQGRTFMWGGTALGVLLLIGLVTHGFGLFGGSRNGADAPLFVRQGDKITVPENSPLRKRLTVIQVQSEQFSPKLVLPGVVESDPARTAAVLPPLSGRVVELKVGLGQRVARGQALAVIDSPDLAQAYDDNDKAADTFQLTSKDLARQEEQFKIGAASAKDLDEARSDNTQALAEYNRTRARLKMLGVPADTQTRERLLVVTAPVGGSITSLDVAPGNMINDATQPIMTVADLSTVWVTALVPEKDIAALATGQTAEAKLDAYPDRTLRGKVLFVADVIEPDSRRNKVRIAFQNGDFALKPNMYATVTLQGTQQSRVTLPTSALLMNNDRTSVFVATAPWTFERRTVEPELEEGTTVAIRSGLNPGEQVVVKGGILLND